MILFNLKKNTNKTIELADLIIYKLYISYIIYF